MNLKPSNKFVFAVLIFEMFAYYTPNLWNLGVWGGGVTGSQQMFNWYGIQAGSWLVDEMLCLKRFYQFLSHLNV